MRIATWNVERLKHKKSLDRILRAIEKVQADILILTETDERVYPPYPYSAHTRRLCEAPTEYTLPSTYTPTENRVSVFSVYPVVGEYETYDPYTAICPKIETPLGNLLLYGTIIGITGNRRPSYKIDLLRQCDDIKRLSAVGDLCVCGDYNCSFADNYYFTNFGRNTLLQTFAEMQIELLTKNQSECIDHIAISRNFIFNDKISIDEWNFDKRLSDHKGIVADIYN